MASDKTINLKEENGLALVGTVIVFLTMSWISVCLRTWTRAFLMNGYQIDDWFMLIAQLIFTVSCAFILMGVHNGLGRHNDAVTNDKKKVAALMWQALATATYVLDMMFIKVSIGVFLLRLSVHRVYTWILWTSLCLIIIWSSVIFFWDIFQCDPVAKQWDYQITTGSCVGAEQIIAAAYSISAMTIVSDWLYALLPIPMLWAVKMTKQAKATVTVVLGLGIFASIATLIRLRFLSDLTDTADILFAGTNAMVWTLVEPGVAIIASSLATIRPLLRAWKIKGFTSTGSTYGTSLSATIRCDTIRPKGGSNMPGFGPHDISLVNIRSESNGGTFTPNTLTTAYSPLNKSLPPLPLCVGGKPGKSEIYVLQSHQVRSPNPSIEQIHDLEAQNQDTSSSGLESGKNRR
ncbi:hypothetical protein BGZ63DRAFT_453992 [Mariannaea sp. PMI_226]|nr:hypothetical protein BGZ63DRAFT_453992 [Mariannaea sp. PMI_226]